MNLRKSNLLLILFCLMLLPRFLPAQIRYQGNNYLEYSIDQKNDDQYFENWTEVYLGYRNWRVGARYEMHPSPQPFSQQKSGYSLAQRFLEYRVNHLVFTLGNYYTLLGRGLVLRSFENRTLRWDTNLDGAKMELNFPLADVQILTGRPRDLAGDRHEWLQAAGLNLKPLAAASFGGTFVTTDLDVKGRVYWGSVFTRISLEWASFYAERAFKDFTENDPSGKAYYLMGNFFVGPLTALLEYRRYENFELTEGLQYNNPPTVFREHLYTLLNRHQRVQDARDEEGYALQVNYALGDLGVLGLNHSRTRSRNGTLLYREYYGQLDVDPTDDINLVGGAGEQRDLEARYLNFVGSAKWGFTAYQAVKAIFEHQHVKILLTDRQFYNQALTLSWDIGSWLTLSVLSERSTDQLAERDYWVGGQLDIQLPMNFELSAFGGNRRKGKICAGGVCINRPEFAGVEFRLTNRF